MKSINLTALLFVAIGLSACGESPAPGSEGAVQVAPPSTATSAAPPIDYLVKNVVADVVPFQPGVATAVGNALVSTGASGFVMYGPYVPFAPGSYRVTVKGSIPNLQNGAEVRFDVVSGAAKSIHGEHVVTEAIPNSGNIAEFDVTIPEGVADLELRAQVTEGADVHIESYQIAKSN